MPTMGSFPLSKHISQFVVTVTSSSQIARGYSWGGNVSFWNRSIGESPLTNDRIH